MNAPSDGLRSGEDLISERFRLGELLGTGGSASVFAATDVNSGALVALKILHPHLSRSEPLREGFFREARAAVGLRHPNVAAVLGVGVHGPNGADADEDPLAWIALERAAGMSLAERVERSGALDVRQSLAVASGVLQALEAAHALGLIHRDVSPANIMVTADPDGVIRSAGVRLVDFGLADAAGRPVLGADLLRSTGTSTGIPGRIAAGDDLETAELGILGSANYMSPEQARGEAVDERGDLYQLGCVLHFALTGRPPFTRDSSEAVMRAHTQAPPPVPSVLFSGIPRTVDRLVVKAMLKDPAGRFSSAGEMLAAIAELAVSAASPIQTDAAVTRVFSAAMLDAEMIDGGIASDDLDSLFGNALGDAITTAPASTIGSDSANTTVFPRLRAAGTARPAVAPAPAGAMASAGSTTVPNPFVEPSPFDRALGDAGFGGAGFGDAGFGGAGFGGAGFGGAGGSSASAAGKGGGTAIWIGAVILAAVIAVAWILSVSGAATPTVAVASPSATPSASSAPKPTPRPSASEDVAIAFPDLTALRLDAARTALLAAGLRLGSVTSTNSTSVADTVLSASANSTPLAAGAPLTAGQSVDLVVASGSNMVPAIAGMPQAAAVAAVQAAGFAVQIVQQPNTALTPGTVVGSTPGNGTVQPLASTVVIAVAGALPSPEPSPSASASASPKPSPSPTLTPSPSVKPSPSPTPPVKAILPITVN
ncbi:MAG: protein kinase [Microbacteriaceae bacterium]|nr:protein kinase [Microbacteriaceae bacterium]